MKTLALFCAVAMVGCQISTHPAETLTSELRVTPSTVSPGDTVRLLVATTNRSARRITSMTCGFGLDFEVTTPAGEVTYPIREMPAICPVLDSNILEPFETDTVEFPLIASGIKGIYRVRGGVRLLSGLGAPSETATFEVR